MEMNSGGSINTNQNMIDNTCLLNEMNLNAPNAAQPAQHNDQLDNLSNLIIQYDSNIDESTAILEQYEHDTDKIVNDKILIDKEQTNQRLFQSFQTSACAVAQMFKDKTQGQQNAWQSFQNSAGAITVLYKDSLEACKVHYDLGITIGQQRKLKELFNWLKKKKRRSIRKDELISFLIGRQFNSAQNSIFQPQVPPVIASSNSNNNNNNTSLFNQQQTQQLNKNRPPPQTTTFFQQQVPGQVFAANQIAANRLNNNNNNSSCPNILSSNANTISENTCSDLATFREALIMHNRSRDTPLANYNANPHHNHHNHNHHHHQHQCDDLDCFFCEQIATHIEHKRSASSNNFDMESPTRKRGRFY